MPPPSFSIGQRVVLRKNFVVGVVVEVNPDGKIKVQPTSGKMLNFQPQENFMPYAEWTQLKEQAAAIPIRRTSLPQVSIRRDPPPRQPKTETFTVGSASQPEFDMAVSAVPTENPWSAHVVEARTITKNRYGNTSQHCSSSTRSFASARFNGTRSYQSVLGISCGSSSTEGHASR